MERCGANAALGAEKARCCLARSERFGLFVIAEDGHMTRHEPASKVIVRLNIARGNATDFRMAGQINRIGDDGRGGIRFCSCSRKNGYGISNAQRKAPPAPAAGGDPRTGSFA